MDRKTQLNLWYAVLALLAMAVLLGGRAAEQLVFDEVSTGAADDLNRATDIASEVAL